jgi:hypothetical protein
LLSVKTRKTGKFSFFLKNEKSVENGWEVKKGNWSESVGSLKIRGSEEKKDWNFLHGKLNIESQGRGEKVRKEKRKRKERKHKWERERENKITDNRTGPCEQSCHRFCIIHLKLVLMIQPWTIECKVISVVGWYHRQHIGEIKKANPNTQKQCSIT